MDTEKVNKGCCPSSGKPWNPKWECCKDCYPEDCYIRPWKWPTRWMLNDREIAGRLGIERPWIYANAFSMILEFLWEQSLTQSKSNWEELLPQDQRTLTHQFQKPRKSGQTSEERPLVLVVVDFKELLWWTKKWMYPISVILAKKYIQAFDQAGIIQWTQCYTGSPKFCGKKIYAIGTWAGHMEFRHREPFMADTPEWRRRLRSFSLQPIR